MLQMAEEPHQVPPEEEAEQSFGFRIGSTALASASVRQSFGSEDGGLASNSMQQPLPPLQPPQPLQPLVLVQPDQQQPFFGFSKVAPDLVASSVGGGAPPRLPDPATVLLGPPSQFAASAGAEALALLRAGQVQVGNGQYIIAQNTQVGLVCSACRA